MSSGKIGFIQIFDSDLDALLKMRGRQFDSPAAEVYAAVMLHYMSGEIDKLVETLALLETMKDESDELSLIHLLASVRLQIRRVELDSAQLRALESRIQLAGLWQGEILFVLSSAYSLLGDFEKSSQLAWKSSQALRDLGARKKSVRALLNYVAEKSHIKPDSHYIPDLHLLYREGKRAGDISAIGLALQGLSRAHQGLGAYSASLRYANRAVAVLAKNAGNQAYYLALVHRAHVLCQLGCFYEAKLDIESSHACSFPEIHSSLELLYRDYPELREDALIKRFMRKAQKPILPEWRERQGESLRKKLGKHEELLIGFLADKSRTKAEIVEYLYGPRLSTETTDRRFSNLMIRVRKRHPDLIVYSDGKYRLTESPMLLDRKAG